MKFIYSAISGFCAGTGVVMLLGEHHPLDATVWLLIAIWAMLMVIGMQQEQARRV